MQHLMQQYDKQPQIVNLIDCYRSFQIIIDFVRDVLLFATEKANVNIPIPIQLQSHRQFIPSKIELMPLIEKSKKNADTPKHDVAKVIALCTFDLLNRNIIIPSTNTIIKPQDIMISVQKRVVLFDNLKKECQKLNISIRSSEKYYCEQIYFF